MCVHTYLCMHVLPVCTGVHICGPAYVRLGSLMCVCMFVTPLCTCVSEHIHTCVCMNESVGVHACAHMCGGAWDHSGACVCICVHVGHLHDVNVCAPTWWTGPIRTGSQHSAASGEETGWRETTSGPAGPSRCLKLPRPALVA